MWLILLLNDDRHDIEVDLINVTPWTLYFDGSVCDDGQGVGVVYISPNGAVFEASCRLEYFSLIMKPNMKHCYSGLNCYYPWMLNMLRLLVICC